MIFVSGCSITVVRRAGGAVAQVQFLAPRHKMNKNQQRVLDYYRSLESKLGYKFITWETKHFGYYPKEKPTFSEQHAQELMQDLIAKNAHLTREDLVLDAGCGYGVVACYLAKKTKAKIIGIDINQYEIHKAKARAEKLGLQNKVSFFVKDYSETGFPKNHFDAIYTMETLSHSPDLQKTLKEFFRILKPGGRIALFEYTLAPDSEFSSYEMSMLDLGIAGTAAMGLKAFRHDAFADVLRKIGFRNVKEQNITKNFAPSVHRLRNIARIPYIFIKLLHAQKHFVNTMIAIEWSRFVDKGLWRYCIFTAEKKAIKNRRI